MGPRKGDGEGILSSQKGSGAFVARVCERGAAELLFGAAAASGSHVSVFSPPSGPEQVQGSVGDKVLQSESCSVEQESIAEQRAKIDIYMAPLWKRSASHAERL